MRERASTDRRMFLKLAGLGLAGSAIAASESITEAEAAVPPEGEETAGYRETEDVRRYYEVARF